MAGLLHVSDAYAACIVSGPHVLDAVSSKDGGTGCGGTRCAHVNAGLARGEPVPLAEAVAVPEGDEVADGVPEVVTAAELVALVLMESVPLPVALAEPVSDDDALAERLLLGLLVAAPVPDDVVLAERLLLGLLVALAEPVPEPVPLPEGAPVGDAVGLGVGGAGGAHS